MYTQKFAINWVFSKHTEHAQHAVQTQRAQHHSTHDVAAHASDMVHRPSNGHNAAELPTEGLVRPPLPIPAPPAFDLEPEAEEEDRAKSAKPEAVGQLYESQASGTEAESDEAARKALPSDDDDFSEEVLDCSTRVS